MEPEQFLLASAVSAIICGILYALVKVGANTYRASGNSTPDDDLEE